ncbi:MAG: CGGC domain-containing protein [Desulfobaccales bacterium]
MARIGILTCSNCTQDTNCASVVCLSDLRKRRGFFESYPKDEPLDLIGIINCAGCPTLAAPEKILKRVRALTEFHIDALHLSFCMVALCPFVKPYTTLIKREFPDINIVMGTHKPVDREHFTRGVKELLCQTLTRPQTMNDLIRGTLKIPEN